MLKQRVSIDEARLAAFCRKHGVAKLSLFGSVLRNDFDLYRSDIDVVVEFRVDAHRSLFKLIEMEQELANLFGRVVDLTTAGSLSKYFRDDVISGAMVLYDAT